MWKIEIARLVLGFKVLGFRCWVLVLVFIMPIPPYLKPDTPKPMANDQLKPITHFTKNFLF